jgi:tRNA(Ile)-lysidine synthase
VAEQAAALVAAHGRLVLAVSGGVDSMTLLVAVAEAMAGAPAAGRPEVVVATFDHGTGPAATDAAAFVAHESARLGLPCVRGGGAAATGAGTEAGWRAARWRFLREVAAGATVVTAHTRDDQVETIAHRILRGAGARGIAGLYAPTPGVARPFVDLSRSDIVAFAKTRSVTSRDDPTNASPRFARNRLRHDILPAIGRVHSGFAQEMLGLARRAAAWRAEVDALARSLAVVAGDTLTVDRSAIADWSPGALAVVWPAMLATIGVTADRRGTSRLAVFTTRGQSGARIQLSGGVDVERRGGVLIARRRQASLPSPADPCDLAHSLRFGRWRFSLIPDGSSHPDSSWVAELPADAVLRVRRWHPGDRMPVPPPVRARRVKRFFSDARIPAYDRHDWPVVTANGEIVWIPGVRRSDAASARSGRPVVRYACERFQSGHARVP